MFEELDNPNVVDVQEDSKHLGGTKPMNDDLWFEKMLLNTLIIACVLGVFVIALLNGGF